jgi:NodT family efflux transporter outer membrane factor (OMF) lipoprotein
MRAAPSLAPLATLAALGLAGCAVGPDFHRPAPPQASSYLASPPPAEPSGTEPAAGSPNLLLGSDPPSRWWEGYGSPALDALVAQALRANPTLAAAEAALRQARENAKAQQGVYFPTLQASAAASRNRNAVQVLSPTLTSGAAIFNLYTPQLSVSFVPDLLGGNRRAVESLNAQAQASADEYDAAYLSLAANVVGAAIQEAGLHAQIDATGQVIAAERESLALMRSQLQLGAIAEADVLAQDTALAALEATLPPLQKGLDQQHDLLAVLCGRLPADQPAGTLALDQLRMPAQIPLGVPSQLVERRPDVRAAEAQLHAATAAVGVTIANLLPQLSLTAAIGNAATQTADLFSSMTEYWTAGASLSQTLFAGGTLVHRERAARAGLDLAGAQYRVAVLTAFQNVADALRALSADEASVQAGERSVAAATQSLDIARGQYALGAVSYLALLSAEQAYQQAVAGRIAALTSRYVDVAALFQALGGQAPTPAH